MLSNRESDFFNCAVDKTLATERKGTGRSEVNKRGGFLRKGSYFPFAASDGGRPPHFRGEPSAHKVPRGENRLD